MRFSGSLLFLMFLSLRIFSADPSLNISNRFSIDSVRHYLSVLASDSLEGREPGKLGQRAAAKFIADFYDQNDISAPQGVRYQNHPLQIKSNREYNLYVNHRDYLYYRDFYYLSGKTDTTLILPQLFFAGYGISSRNYDDFKQLDIKAEAVLLYGEAPESKKIRKAQEKDAFSALTVLQAKHPSVVFFVVDTLYSIVHALESDGQLRSQINNLNYRVVFIQRDCAAEFFDSTDISLANRVDKINRRSKPRSDSLDVQIKLSMLADPSALTGQNVFGFIEGTDLKNEVVVISAHYDHLGVIGGKVYHGADDNGSGTSAVMEIARLFSDAAKHGDRPRRSVLFFNVSGEEKRLLGSSWFVAHPMLPLSGMVTDLNIDMIGRVDSTHLASGNQDYVYVISSLTDSPDLIKFNDDINNAYTSLKLDYKYSDESDPNQFYRRSDHYNFVKNGVPILFFFNGIHSDYHQPSDTVDKIDFELLKKRAQLVFLDAWHIANSATSFKKPKY